MNYTLIELFSYSIIIPAAIGLARYTRIDRDFLPFIFLVWVGLLNEIITTVVVDHGHSNAINTNIYSLIESLLILCLFRNWSLFKRHPRMFYFLLIGLLGLWVTENLVLSSFRGFGSYFISRRFSSYFIIVSSFAIVLMSISMINRLMLVEKKSMIGNAVFLTCIGFVLFFTYAMLVEIFWVYGLSKTKIFRLYVFRILAYINLAVNLIYAIAILWIPRKRESLLQ